MNDHAMRQDVEYQAMEMKVEKADLWREDVEDICELTGVKMDLYLIVSTFQLIMTVLAMCEGRMVAGTPNWLVGAHTISVVSTFSFLLLSMWFAVTAMVAAASYKARIRTQVVR